MELIGKTIANRYEIIENIGIGGMATVYKARCKLLNRFVAVKVLKDEFSKDAEFVKRFRAEAQSAASLTHPNIVSVYDVGEENKVNYIVMELLEGLTLKDVIEEKGKLSNEETLKYASQIASALEAAHASKIVHRDIKPQNIVLTANNIAKVTDFGIAKMSSKETITSSTSTIGSVHYFSPEHAKGCYTDERSDIYSLGVVMYEMATGVLPFNADSAVSVALMQIQEIPKEPKEVNPEVSDALNNIIMKAMSKTITERYQSASDMLDDIFAAINNPSYIFFKNENSDLSHTQVVPIIGLTDDVSPKLSDSIYPDKKERKNKNKKGKKNKAIPILIVIILVISIAGLGILTVNLVKIIKEKQPNEQVEKIEYAPKLIGEVFEDAKKNYAEKGLTLTVGKYEYNSEFEYGVIISQSVNEGEYITGDSIEVNVSKGTQTTVMIDVVGSDYTVAKYELESMGLKPVFIMEKNDKVAQNIIIEQAIPKGEEVAVGTEIEIKVSEGTGKKTVIVPEDYAGKSLAEVEKALTDLGLLTDITYVEKSSMADGVVVSLSVKKNAELEVGALVKLEVNRLEKSKLVTIDPTKYISEGTTGEITIEVKARIDGAARTTVYSPTTISEPYSKISFTIYGYEKAVLYVYINNTTNDSMIINEAF